MDWNEVYRANGSNEKVRRFKMILEYYFFPLKKVRKKDDDLPWFNDVARKKVKKKKAIYKAEMRSPRWKAVAADLDSYLNKRKEKFLAKQRGKISDPETCKSFFKNVKSFSTAEKPLTFDIKALKPGCSNKEVAEVVAGFFNRISQEFDPLDPFQIPKTYDRQLPMLGVDEIEKRLRSCKKPPW